MLMQCSELVHSEIMSRELLRTTANKNRTLQALRLTLLTLLVVCSTASWSHGLQFSTLNLQETAVGEWDIQFQYSDRSSALEQAKVVVSDNCRDLSSHRQKVLKNTVKQYWSVYCENPTTPLHLKLEGLRGSISTLFHLTSADGFEYEMLLNAENTLIKPTTLLTNTSPPKHQNLVMEGITHILSGFDHLLFLLLMLLLLSNKNTKVLLLTITAFTVGHSITLSLAALDVITVSAKFTETLIAASLVFLAAEIVRNKPTLTFRFPALVAGFFGLFHGLGFANTLSEMISNSESRMWALATFNVGVEIGQLLFIIPIWIVISRAGLFFLKQGFQTKSRLTAITAQVIAYSAGSLGVLWAMQRIS